MQWNYVPPCELHAIRSLYALALCSSKLTSTCCRRIDVGSNLAAYVAHSLESIRLQELGPVSDLVKITECSENKSLLQLTPVWSERCPPPLAKLAGAVMVLGFWVEPLGFEPLGLTQVSLLLSGWEVSRGTWCREWQCTECHSTACATEYWRNSWLVYITRQACYMPHLWTLRLVTL